jgi:hypothetical protein
LTPGKPELENTLNRPTISSFFYYFQRFRLGRERAKNS